MLKLLILALLLPGIALADTPVTPPPLPPSPHRPAHQVSLTDEDTALIAFVAGSGAMGARCGYGQAEQFCRSQVALNALVANLEVQLAAEARADKKPLAKGGR